MNKTTISNVITFGVLLLSLCVVIPASTVYLQHFLDQEVDQGF